MPILTPDQFEATLGEIVRRLRDGFAPVAIYLFGSYAYGTPDRDSDIDVLVVVEDSPDSAYQRDAKAYLALLGIPVPIDVQVYTKQEFDERASLSVSFERTRRTKGRHVYAA